MDTATIERSPIDEIPDEVFSVINHLGFPQHIKGYHFTAYAIYLASKDPLGSLQMTKVIYPEIAKKFNSTPSRVERAIRHAIEVVFEKGNYESLMNYFEHSIPSHKDKPSNSQFICTLGNAVRKKVQPSNFS